MTEREAIVAWLRREAGILFNSELLNPWDLAARRLLSASAHIRWEIADAIEAGQHLENKDG